MNAIKDKTERGTGKKDTGRKNFVEPMLPLGRL